MTRSERTELVEAFVEEHRMLIRGLAKILEKVEILDFVAARKQADELDQMAGPHIQFEEETLYPEVERTRGPQLGRQLREEHSTVRRAIGRLLEVDLSQVDLSMLHVELSAALKTAVQHTETCGNLTGHLRAMPPAKQRQAMSRLIQLRKRGTRWTQLPAR